MAWKSLTTRVQGDFKDEVDRIAAENGKTTSDFVRICVEDACHGHYRLDGDHLVPTEEYLNALRPMDVSVPIDDEFIDEENDCLEYKMFGFDTLVRLLRKKEYPDEHIKKIVDSMVSTAYDMPKFNQRRMKDNDCGC